MESFFETLNIKNITLHTHTHTHTNNQKGKTNLDLLEKEIVSGSGKQCSRKF